MKALSAALPTYQPLVETSLEAGRTLLEVATSENLDQGQKLFVSIPSDVFDAAIHATKAKKSFGVLYRFDPKHLVPMKPESQARVEQFLPYQVHPGDQFRELVSTAKSVGFEVIEK